MLSVIATEGTHLMEQVVANGQRSISGQSWVFPTPAYSESSLDHLCEKLGITRGLGSILAARDLLDWEAAERFLNPADQHLHAPGGLMDMDKAMERIYRALVGFEKIVIFGDYDVDGTASTAILYSYLKRLDARVHYFVPHRINDGFGINPHITAKFKNWGVDLVITTDHGSTDVEGAQLLRQQGIDLIVTDHHQLQENRPHCEALLNPHQEGCAYPFKELSATGVVFKLICALDDFLIERKFWDRGGMCHTAPDYYLDLVALATVADMTPLLGENRILVKLGLDMINTQPRPGLSGLMRECNVRNTISPSTISFRIAPKINALGRIGDPGIGVKLLMSHSYTEARKLARHMVELNKRRRSIEQEVYAKAMKQAEARGGGDACIVVVGDWHPGVIGSIASRLASETGKPTVVLTTQNDSRVLGSARSWSKGSVLEALMQCEGLLERCGGHPNAAGLALCTENVEAFTQEFHQAMECAAKASPAETCKELEIDAWVTQDMLGEQFFSEVARMSPFGYRNPEPAVAVRGVKVDDVMCFSDRHLKFNLCCSDGQQIEANAWHRPDWRLSPSQQYDAAFVPQIYNGPDGPRPQVKIVDMMCRN